jgi:predicted 3-demethylubiquinone-9 3-methyltransferase (glyoxalase superfamily)
LTWPSWELFRRENFGQESSQENYIPFELSDPQEFYRTLLSLLDSTGFHEATAAMNHYTSHFPNSPFSTFDSDESKLESVIKAVKDVPKSPSASNGTPEDLPNLKTQTVPNPSYMVLSLWACARNLAFQADTLFSEALDMQSDMMKYLSNEDNQNLTKKQNFMSPDYFPVMRSLFTSWLILASPFLTAEDRLWTPFDDQREEASIALFRFKFVKAKIWPESSSLT